MFRNITFNMLVLYKIPKMELIAIGFTSQNFGNKLQEDKPHKIQINNQNKTSIFEVNYQKFRYFLLTWKLIL